MNSLNHYAYGSIVNYIVRHLAGLQPLEPGYRKVLFKPTITPFLKHISLSYDSNAGNYAFNWKINNDGTISIHAEIPFDASAILELPEREPEELEAGIYDLTYKPEKDYRILFDENTLIEDMVKNEKFNKLMREIAPKIEGGIERNGVEILSCSLAELIGNPAFDLSEIQIRALIEKLPEIKMEF